ncbi:uncharacterized protein LOC119737117 [Patiria miniata]|uniref:Uncharacterized protein n=1 Tax=Patiria miniata TaxID=46514 RepID=A0A914ATZ3_PATMI|nr:uncharacterized protein LOC119737117 [Patiria miniata]
MDPANEHDPTMDAHIVHAVNVNNKKEMAEMKFLTKSLANARHVQQSIYRQEEKDLIRQLWKLQKEKERRHPEIDYNTRRSGHGLQRLSSEQMDGSHSSRRGSYNVLYRGSDHHYHPHPPSPSHHQRVHDDKNSYMGRAPEVSHPTTGYHYHAPTKGDKHSHDRDHGASSHHLPFSKTSSHHFNPEQFVHHHRPEYYPMPPAHRRHSTPGYHPTEIPGVVSQSSRLNAIVQPAGYGHSIAEHAAHLGMHRHYHRGVPHHAYRNPSHGPTGHPSHLMTDDIHNIGSYESLTRYINLLDYQASEESKADRRHKRPHHHKNDDKQGPSAHPDELGEAGVHGREQSVEEVIQVVGDAYLAPVSDKKETEVDRPSGHGKEVDGGVVPQDDSEPKSNGAKPKSIGCIGVPSATPSPTTQGTKGTTEGEDAGKDTSHPRPGVAEEPVRSSDKVDPSVTPIAKPRGNGKGTAAVGVDVPAKRSSRRGLHKGRESGLDSQRSRGEVLPQGSSHQQYISRQPSLKASKHHPQPHLTRQILSDLHAIASQPSHHNRHPSTHHRDPPPHHHHHHPVMAHVHPHHSHHQRPREPVTAAERKRLAVELLAREYPVLLRNAPTKFDPMEALMCRYLRLSSTNVETLEEMCREAGIEVGAHAHHQIENANEYVFGGEKP